MRHWIFLALFFPTMLSAEISPSSISSNHASYEDSALVLKGNVELKHSLGLMKSGFARLDKKNQEGTFTTIHLRDNVSIVLKNRGVINCQTADFDFSSLKAKLLPKKGEMVEFKNLSNSSFSLMSSLAEVEFSRGPGTVNIHKIEALDKVEIRYPKLFTLSATRAICYTDSSLVEAEVPSKSNSKVIIFQPSGLLHSTPLVHGEGISFSSEKMVWEEETQQLFLQGDVLLKEQSIGQIHCEDEIEVQQKQEEGKWIISTITAKGKTVIDCAFEDDESTHQLTSYGTMLFDGGELRLTLQSPENRPIVYCQNQMKLLANEAQMHYASDGETIRPTKLFLKGNILLTNLTKGAPHQCAFADQFTYLPDEKKVILTTATDDNVLFWDGERELSISASQIHITRDETGESVKGIGNVRFAFSSEENALLKKLFPFYRQKGESS
ncbi:MAG: hypothetical protein KR126chlam1_01252 [Chlamydiae bacterium]|nr:hypothetical protein [Chlamydiota bacterium]